MRIAEAAIAAFGDGDALADFSEVGEQGLPIFFIYLRAGRHAKHDVVSIGAMAVLAHAVFAALGLEVLLIAIVDERVETIDCLDDDVTAFSAVAAIRPAELDKLLAPKRDAAISARAGCDINFRLVQEFHVVAARRL